jgi:hypothetical protein
MTTDDLSDINFNWDGASFGVLPDVSMSEPAQQPTTATGNGTGYYVDNTWQSALFGTIGQALNYALVRDQMQFGQKAGYTTGVPVTATPQAAAAIQNNRIILIGAVAIGLAFVLKGK